MDFDKACGIGRPHAMGFGEKMDRYIALLGYEELKRFLPRSQDELCKAYKQDRNFNTVPLKEWEKAAGYDFRDRQGGPPPRCAGPFYRLVTSHGVTVFSVSECVSILKHTAERWVLERLGSIYEDHWAVFEAWNADRDKAHRYDIFCFDCVAVFPDEKQAIDFEAKNPEHRVRRMIRGNGPALMAGDRTGNKNQQND